MENISFLQPPTQTAYLRDLLNDPFNKFCVDCTKSESTHANISFGTFICADCALAHIENFGMDRSYVKDIFEEVWDQYQIKSVSLGGNRKFWDFMKQYKSENKDMLSKYDTSESQYYKKRLAALIVNKHFTESPPAKNIDEYFDKSLNASKKVVAKGEVVLSKMGNAIE